MSQNPVIRPVDLHQKISAALVVRPSGTDAYLYEVRIVFYRVVWKGDGSGEAPGQQKMEMETVEKRNCQSGNWMKEMVMM